jgi:hypothetical protein
MPKIQPYQSQIDPRGAVGGVTGAVGSDVGYVPRPQVRQPRIVEAPNPRNARGSDFSIGEGLVAVGNELGRAADLLHEEQVKGDISNVRVTMARTRADWDVAFKQRSTSAPVGDPTFAASFVQDFQDHVGKARDIVQTREGQRVFEQLSAELSGHFAEKAGIFQAASAGVKAAQDWTTALNAYATSLTTDPTSYDAVRRQAQAELYDPNGPYAKLPSDARGKLQIEMRNTLAQSYIHGLVDNASPQLAKQILMTGKLDSELEPGDKQRLISMANQGITAERVAAEHQSALAKKAEKDRIDAINNDLMGKFVDKKLTVADVRAAGLPAFGEGSQNTWIDKIKQQTKDLTEGPAKTNPTLFNSLRERMDLPPGSPRKMQSADEIWSYFGKGLSEADAFRLERRFLDSRNENGQRWSQAENEFIKNIRPMLDKSTMNSLDVGGGERIQRFSVFMRDKADEMRKANKDPYELFRPDSPEYLGKFIPQFQTGAQRQAVDFAGRINNAMSRKPGETPAQYFERTKPK